MGSLGKVPKQEVWSSHDKKKRKYASFQDFFLVFRKVTFRDLHSHTEEMTSELTGSEVIKELQLLGNKKK